MKENELSFTFHIEKELMGDFEKAIERKGKELGIPLTKKQALHLAIKEVVNKW